MKEKDFNIRFNHWLKVVHRTTGAYELKVTKTDSLPFSAVKPHQIAALRAAKNGTLVYKIPDIGLGQKPFDNVCLSGTAAFVGVLYPSGVAYLIDVDIFIGESQTSERKSLLEARAKVIHSYKIE